VDVSGSRFCIAPALFKKVKNLPWYEHRGVPHLNSNPDVFETLLQYFLFGSLPDISAMARHELTELQGLAPTLHSVKDLIAHIDTERKNSKRRSAFLRKGIPSLTTKKQRFTEDFSSIQETVYPFDECSKDATINVDYIPNLEASDSEESHNISDPVSSEDSSTNAVPAVAPPKGGEEKFTKIRGRFRNMLGGKKDQNTVCALHEEWCASEYIL
jgi:hypothetical protein